MANQQDIRLLDEYATTYWSQCAPDDWSFLMNAWKRIKTELTVQPDTTSKKRDCNSCRHMELVVSQW